MKLVGLSIWSIIKTVIGLLAAIVTILLGVWAFIDKTPKPDLEVLGSHRSVFMPNEVRYLSDTDSISTSTADYLRDTNSSWTFVIKNKGKTVAKDIVLKIPFGDLYSLSKEGILKFYNGEISIGNIKVDEEVVVNVWSDDRDSAFDEETTKVIYEEGGVVPVKYPTFLSDHWFGICLSLFLMGWFVLSMYVSGYRIVRGKDNL